MTLIYARGWDLASTEKTTIKSDPDYTASTLIAVEHIPTNIAGFDGKTVYIDRIYIEDAMRGRWEGMERNKIMLATAMSDNPDVVWGIEGVAGYKDCYTEMSTILRGIRQVHLYKGVGDKVAKSHDLSVAIDLGNVYMRNAPWTGDLKEELKVFYFGKHDDWIDSMNIALWTAIHCSCTAIISGNDLYQEDEYTMSTMHDIEFAVCQLQPVICQRDAYNKFIRQSLLQMMNKYLLPGNESIYNHIDSTINLLDEKFQVKKINIY